MTSQPTAMTEKYVSRAADAANNDEIVSIIQEVVSSDGIYHMGELLYEPRVQKVRSNEQQKQNCWFFPVFGENDSHHAGGSTL